jgi:tetratricopeptide (TPR) repeat protein
MKLNLRKIFILKLIVAFLILQICGSFVNPFSDLYAQANHTCSDNLEKAEDAYYDGEFGESIKLIGTCLKQPNITEEQKSYAYTILSRNFIALDEIEKAKEFINKNLDINPDYLPTIEQETPVFVNLVVQEKEKRKKVKKVVEEAGISSWLWIGAGTAVAATAVIVLISSGDENKDKKPLPEPPEFP